jgi:Protein of unknown function (DUF1592)/Protein of unknown function (DUF1588)/Protein of unknown function (DUF1595)/Protein of unknown function (DUF1585)
MIEKHLWVAVGALSLALGGCTGSVGNSGNGDSTGNGTGNSPPSGAGNGSGGSGSSGGGANGYSGATSTASLICSPGVPATSEIPRMKDAAYDAVMNDLLGVTAVGTAAPSSLLVPDFDGSMTDIAWNGYLTAADQIASQVMSGANKAKFISCDPSVGTCLSDTVKAFGRKAFRRPLTDTEVTSFMRLNSLTPAGTPAEVAEAILYAFLASPSFIMLPELAQTQQGTSFQLSSYEVATRLSFLLWGTLPDDTLSAAADAGQLATKDQILSQAQRMLASPKVAPVVVNFLHQYAGIQSSSHWFNNTTHDATKYPSFNTASYAPLLAEVDSVFQDLVLNKGTFKDLFLTNVAFVTSDTAAIYGLDASKYTTTPTRVTLDSTQRPGLFTRAGFLSTFAHFDTTAPILRGAFVTTSVLGIPLGQPPAGALQTPIPPGNYTTQRQEIDALTSPGTCAACHHTLINPSGYVLEKYNAIGSWQDTDPLGGAIDGSADVYLTPTASQHITTPIALMTAIASTPSAKHFYAQQLVAFASSRLPNANDACTVDALATNMAADSYPLLNLISDYTQTDSFHLRSVGN